MTRHTTFPLGVLLSAILASSWPATPAPSAGPQVAAACSTIAEPSRRLELADGGIVSVDMRSLARSGQSVLAIGRHAYVFPRSAQSRTSPIVKDSIIGVLIDRGNVSLVFSPMKPRPVFHPHAVADPDGSFHVLFATAGDTLPHYVDASDTATLWYARLEKGNWRSVQRVASVRGAALNQESSSDLLVRNGQLSFLFPFVDDRDSSSKGGVILLRRRNAIWSIDTLRTYRRPSAVRARHGPTGESIVAVFPQSGPGNNSIAQRLYLARFDSAWSSRRVIAGDGHRAVLAPTLAARGDGFVVSWNTWPVWQSDSLQLEWLQMDAHDRVSIGPIIDFGENGFPFELVAVDDRYPLWLYHGWPFGQVATLVVAMDSTLKRLPDLRLPFFNPGTIS
ncbi:MAG: hypothetical protein ACRD2A_13095, partial [Vicinamibacterales bacterium]